MTYEERDQANDDLVLNIVINHLYNMGERRTKFMKRLSYHLTGEIKEKEYTGIFITRRYKHGIYVLSNASALITCREASNGIMVYEVGRNRGIDYQSYLNQVKERTPGWEDRQRRWIEDNMKGENK